MMPARQAVSWDPYRDINNRFDQLIRSFFGDGPGLTAAGDLSPLAAPVDVEETDNAYTVDIDLPNVNPEEVTIEMRGEELRVSGQFQQQERSGVVRRQNRPQGEFEYVIDLPSDIDPNRVDATYDRGVLTITVAKAQDAHPRRIEIRSAQGQQSGRGDGQQSNRQQSDRRQSNQQQANQGR
jgi:HSP20 family protein